MVSVEVTNRACPGIELVPLDQKAIHSKPNVNLPSQYIALQTQQLHCLLI